ncbi:MAG TPA: single-stranded DNA-binding protein [candidate division CPR3 bacterium]|uniref:Single-stranded DNA-binding protein n=1 Tax=candidate division CPR3 bacterium TaxID=2268181 RepID=A0A7C1NXW4_UNCC3|nr:single-stranded DNA-binding protein [candidate division CPR3 bacterium]
MEILNKIQKALKAPKGQLNKFGNYNYRSCEDILEAIKPLLGEATLTISDKIVLVGDRYYVRAVATLTHDKQEKSVSAYARETLNKKGMDEAQITGAASSYARKYALNGLFAIDDTKDADTTNINGNPVGYISKEQVKQIEDSAIELKVDDKLFLSYMGIESIEKMLKVDFQKAMSALEAKREKNSEK